MLYDKDYSYLLRECLYERLSIVIVSSAAIIPVYVHNVMFIITLYPLHHFIHVYAHHPSADSFGFNFFYKISMYYDSHVNYY